MFHLVIEVHARQHRWRNAILIVCAAISLAMYGCDGDTLMTGNLYDGKGSALSGYKVTLIVIDDSGVTRDQHTCITDLEGGFRVGGAHAPKKLKYEFIITDPNGLEVWKEFGYPLMSARKIVAKLPSDIPDKQ